MPRYCSYLSFQTSGTSSTSSSPFSSALDLEPDDDVEVVRDFVGLDAGEVVLVHLIGGLVGLPRRHVREPGKCFCTMGRNCSQNASERPTWFSQKRLWDSWIEWLRDCPSGPGNSSASSPIS